MDVILIGQLGRPPKESACLLMKSMNILHAWSGCYAISLCEGIMMWRGAAEFYAILEVRFKKETIHPTQSLLCVITRSFLDFDIHRK